MLKNHSLLIANTLDKLVRGKLPVCLAYSTARFQDLLGCKGPCEVFRDRSD